MENPKNVHKIITRIVMIIVGVLWAYVWDPKFSGSHIPEKNMRLPFKTYIKDVIKDTTQFYYEFNI